MTNAILAVTVANAGIILIPALSASCGEIPNWPPEELAKRSSLVVIGTVESIHRTEKRAASVEPFKSTFANADAEITAMFERDSRVVEATIRITAVLKGRAMTDTIPLKFVVVTGQLGDEVANGWKNPKLEMGGKSAKLRRHYLFFFKNTSDDRLEPVTGSFYAAYSIRELKMCELQSPVEPQKKPRSP